MKCWIPIKMIDSFISAPHSLFYIIGILILFCSFSVIEYRRQSEAYLKYWIIGIIIYILRIAFLITTYSIRMEAGYFPIFIFSLNLLLAGAVIILFNIGIDFLLKLRKKTYENLILGSVFLVVGISFHLFNMDVIWILSSSRFVLGLGFIIMAFGFYRIWIVEKIDIAKYLAIVIGAWGIFFPLTIVYVISLNINIPSFIVESIFVTFFVIFLISFVTIYSRKKETFLLAHLENIRENSDNIFLLLDKNGNIIRMSNSFAKRFSWSYKKILKSTFTDLISSESIDNYMEKWGMVIFGKQAVFEFNLNPLISDNPENRFRFVFMPLYDKEKLSCVSVLGKDISPQYKIDQAISKISTEKNAVEHELEEFLSMASHELQSPLISLEGYVTALSHALKGVELPAEVLQYPDFIKKSVNKVSALIQSILDLSRVNPKNSPLTAVDLNHVMARVEGDIVQQKEVNSYKLNIADKLPLVIGNSIHLGQLFLNLIKNSIKYSFPDRKPEIDIFIEKKDKNWITIGVRDNGIGIPEEHFNNIFSPMKRLHMLDAEGYGLGLTLVKKIIDSHGGSILVESKVNEGSTFFVKLKKFKKTEK